MNEALTLLLIFPVLAAMVGFWFGMFKVINILVDRSCAKTVAAARAEARARTTITR